MTEILPAQIYHIVPAGGSSAQNLRAHLLSPVRADVSVLYQR